MRNVTVRLREELIERLDDEAEERGVSRSEHVRDTLAKRTDADRLRERLDARERRITELEAQLRKRSDVEEKIEHLPDKLRDDDPDPPFPVRWYHWWRRRSE